MTRRNLLDNLGLVLLALCFLAIAYGLTLAAQEHVIEQEAQPQ